MSFPAYMTTEQLREYGFAISRDNPNKAYCEKYPTLSVRWRCETCGMWSAVFGGKKLECQQCRKRKPLMKESKQYLKLYDCCGDRDCPIRQETFQVLRDVGIDTNWPGHDGFGEYISLGKLKDLADVTRYAVFDRINEHSVSKFGARMLVHPGAKGAKARSKLPKGRGGLNLTGREPNPQPPAVPWGASLPSQCCGVS